MDLLDGVEVACFDLFDTLIRIDTSRLPAVRWGGDEIRTTLPVVHEKLFAERGVPLDRLLVDRPRRNIMRRSPNASEAA